jgi:hypothetical protein
MADASFSNDDLKLQVERLLDNMIKLGCIRLQDKSNILENVTKNLSEQFNNQVPKNLFEDKNNQKKISALIVCASLENTYKNNPSFKTANLTKALFDPSDPSAKFNKNDPQAKQTIDDFFDHDEYKVLSARVGLQNPPTPSPNNRPMPKKNDLYERAHQLDEFGNRVTLSSIDSDTLGIAGQIPGIGPYGGFADENQGLDTGGNRNADLSAEIDSRLSAFLPFSEAFSAEVEKTLHVSSSPFNPTPFPNKPIPH